MQKQQTISLAEVREELKRLDNQLAQIAGQTSRVPTHLRYQYQDIMIKAKKLKHLALDIQRIGN
jgi:uncharacterized protein YoxC